MTETVTAATPIFTETSVIVITVCTTIVLLSIIFYARKFKVRREKDGDISIQLGSTKTNKAKQKDKEETLGTIKSTEVDTEEEPVIV